MKRMRGVDEPWRPVLRSGNGCLHNCRLARQLGSRQALGAAMRR
jgi:hypothetical protein